MINWPLASPCTIALPPPTLSVSLPAPVVLQPSPPVLLPVPVAHVTPHGPVKPLAVNTTSTPIVVVAPSRSPQDVSSTVNGTLPDRESRLPTVDGGGGGAMAGQPPPAVYPPCSVSPKKKSVASLGEVQIPVAFAAPVPVALERGTSVLPRQLPPPYVVFGGARYDHVPLVKKAIRPLAEIRDCCQRANAMRQATLDHVLGQLELAGMYLKMEQRASALTPKVDGMVHSGLATTSTITPSEEGLFSPKNIWTVAYTGTVEVLHAFVGGLGRDVINAKGCVLYNRRHYGIKKCGDRFVLGLGQKATPLQFAAIAGHLESIILLLHYGAEDNFAPKLKDIIGADGMELIQGWQTVSRGRRAARCSRKRVDCVQEESAPPRLTAQEVVPPLLL